MSLGLESKTVRVVPYDSEWAAMYQAEAARLRTFLDAARVDIALEHTGSTAVEGLAAKPIIDILGGLHSGEARASVIDALMSAGYVHRGEQGIPGREFFRRGEPRQYHLHLVLIGSDFWRDHRDFRDYLRIHRDERDAYAALKAELAQRYPKDREAYTDGKAEFVQRVIALARASQRRQGLFTV